MTVPCPSCGHLGSPGDRFCARCGTRVEPGEAGRFCTRCGEGLTADASFCASCGTPAVDAAAPREDPLPPSNGNRVATEDEDLLSEWESALRPLPPPPPRGEDPAITETIVRMPPVTESFPIPVEPWSPRETTVAPVPARSSAPPRREPGTPFRFPLGAMLALLGAVAVIASAVVPWDGAFRASLPRDIAAARLIDSGAARDGVSLGVVLLMAGTLGALVALLTMAVPILKPIRRVVGLLCLSLPVFFAFRTAGPLLADGNPTQLWSSLGVGVYLAAGGAFIQVVAGRWFRR